MAEITKAELIRRSQDIIRVYNPTNENYVVEWDKALTNTQWIIPHKNSNQFGSGMGMRDVPYFIAIKYLAEMTKKCIYLEAEEEWKKLRKNYGATEYVAKEEERLVIIKLRDNKKLDEWRSKLWVGLVRRNGDINPNPVTQERQDRWSGTEEMAIKRLGLEDRVIEEENKKDFINQIAK